MPRIEIIPDGWENSVEKRQGDGSPTIDVCKECARAFVETEDVPADMLTENLIHVDENAVVGSTEVEHPPFEYEEYVCYCCGDELTGRDN